MQHSQHTLESSNRPHVSPNLEDSLLPFSHPSPQYRREARMAHGHPASASLFLSGAPHNTYTAHTHISTALPLVLTRTQYLSFRARDAVLGSAFSACGLKVSQEKTSPPRQKVGMTLGKGESRGSNVQTALAQSVAKKKGRQSRHFAQYWSGLFINSLYQIVSYMNIYRSKVGRVCNLFIVQ